MYCKIETLFPRNCGGSDQNLTKPRPESSRKETPRRRDCIDEVKSCWRDLPRKTSQMSSRKSDVKCRTKTLSSCHKWAVFERQFAGRKSHRLMCCTGSKCSNYLSINLIRLSLSVELDSRRVYQNMSASVHWSVTPARQQVVQPSW